MNGCSPHEHRPLLGYAALTAAFNGLAAAYVVQHRRSGRRWPQRFPAGDLALMAGATFKLSRLIAKDKVTSVLRSPFTRYKGEAGPSEVEEEARGPFSWRSASCSSALTASASGSPPRLSAATRATRTRHARRLPCSRCSARPTSYSRRGTRSTKRSSASALAPRRGHGRSPQQHGAEDPVRGRAEPKPRKTGTVPYA
jgi:hypothetical protein